MPLKKKRMTVEEYLDSLDPRASDLTNQLRAIIKKTLPTALEEINPWGNPIYTIGRNHVAWIINYKNHVSLGFRMGSKLHSELLEGTGSSLRHIKVRNADDINESEFVRLLGEAAKLSYNYGR